MKALFFIYPSKLYNFISFENFSANLLQKFLRFKEWTTENNILPGIGNLLKIKEYTKINLNWLLTGEGEMFLNRASIEHTPLQPIVKFIGDKSKVELPDSVTIEEYLAVPLVEDKIAAGSGRIMQDDIKGFVWVYRPELGKKINLVACQVGENEKSMIPIINPKAVVIIDRNDKELIKKGIYGVRLENDECAIKRIQIVDDHIILISENSDAYPPILALVEPKDINDLIVGRVIWVWQGLI